MIFADWNWCPKNKMAEILFSLFNDGEYIDSRSATKLYRCYNKKMLISFLSDVRILVKLCYWIWLGRSTVKIGRFVNSF